MKASRLRIGPSFELRFDVDSRRAISIGRNISVWDLESRKRIVHSHPLKHPSSVRWSPAGSRICVKSTSGELIVVDAESLEITTCLQSSRAGEGCEPAFSPDGSMLLDGTWDGLLATYHIEAGIRQYEHTFPHAMITSIASSRSGILAAVVVQPKSASGIPEVCRHSICIAEWSASGLTLRTIPKKFHNIRALAFDSSEERLVIMCRDAPKGDSIAIVEVDSGQTIALRSSVLSHSGSSIDWSPDRKFVGAVELDGFRFYSAPDLSEVAHLPSKYPSHIEFSNSGKFVALGAWSDGEIRPVASIVGLTSH